MTLHLRPAASVLRLAKPHTRVERAGRLDLDAGRFAVLAHHSDVPVVTLSFRSLVQQLVERGYQVLVVSSSTVDGHLDWSGLDLGGTRVIRKPNVGYDFGSWAVGLDHLHTIGGAECVVLANDSLAGPFAPVAQLLDRFEGTPADVWGLTETMQFSRHLQSYFLGFRRGVLTERPLAQFWTGVRHYDDKNLVIHRNEIGLGRLLQREGYAVDAAFPAGRVVAPGDNPTIAGWRTLLDRGMPFVKREIVRSPHLAPDGDRIRGELRRRFGVDVSEWI